MHHTKRHNASDVFLQYLTATSLQMTVTDPHWQPFFYNLMLTKLFDHILFRKVCFTKWFLGHIIRGRPQGRR